MPSWQAIGGKTSTAGAPGRGLRWICIESLTDLDNMIFLEETTFVFESWICEADGDDKLHSYLLVDSGLHKGLADSTTVVDQLVEEFSQPETSRST
jgi:hypothetical protein